MATRITMVDTTVIRRFQLGSAGVGVGEAGGMGVAAGTAAVAGIVKRVPNPSI